MTTIKRDSITTLYQLANWLASPTFKKFLKKHTELVSHKPLDIIRHKSAFNVLSNYHYKKHFDLEKTRLFLDALCEFTDTRVKKSEINRKSPKDFDLIYFKKVLIALAGSGYEKEQFVWNLNNFIRYDERFDSIQNMSYSNDIEIFFHDIAVVFECLQTVKHGFHNDKLQRIFDQWSKTKSSEFWLKGYQNDFFVWDNLHTQNGLPSGKKLYCNREHLSTHILSENELYSDITENYDVIPV